MQKKKAVSIVVILLILNITRSMGIKNIPIWAMIIALIVCITGAVVNISKHKGSKKGNGYIIAIFLIVIAMGSISIISVVIQNSYPQISHIYKPIIKTLLTILFIALLIVVYANLIYEHKNRNKFKDK